MTFFKCSLPPLTGRSGDGLWGLTQGRRGDTPPPPGWTGDQRPVFSAVRQVRERPLLASGDLRQVPWLQRGAAGRAGRSEQPPRSLQLTALFAPGLCRGTVPSQVTRSLGLQREPFPRQIAACEHTRASACVCRPCVCACEHARVHTCVSPQSCHQAARHILAGNQRGRPLYHFTSLVQMRKPRAQRWRDRTVLGLTGYSQGRRSQPRVPLGLRGRCYLPGKQRSCVQPDRGDARA